jgi:hypothetical protein
MGAIVWPLRRLHILAAAWFDGARYAANCSLAAVSCITSSAWPTNAEREIRSNPGSHSGLDRRMHLTGGSEWNLLGSNVAGVWHTKMEPHGSNVTFDARSAAVPGDRTTVSGRPHMRELCCAVTERLRETRSGWLRQSVSGHRRPWRVFDDLLFQLRFGSDRLYVAIRMPTSDGLTHYFGCIHR